MRGIDFMEDEKVKYANERSKNFCVRCWRSIIKFLTSLLPLQTKFQNVKLSQTKSVTALFDFLYT